MSVLTSRSVKCPSCGTVKRRSVAKSVNLRRSPHMRAQIMDGSFQSFDCERCDATYLVDDPFVCFDYHSGDWIAQYPSPDEHQWSEVEPEIDRVIGWALGPTAPPATHAAAKATRLRTVFGLAALREKLVCFEAGLDDATLELTKMRILLDAGQPPVEGPRLRLMAVSADRLELAVTRTADDMDLIGSIRASRAMYNDAEEMSAQDWLPVAQSLRAGSYVDLNRLGA